MSYEYEREKHSLFTPEGFDTLTKVRDKSIMLSNISEVFTLGKLINECTGDSFKMLAAVDYLVERGELKCVFSPGKTAKNIFIRT